jgi:hypothetical protein
MCACVFSLAAMLLTCSFSVLLVVITKDDAAHGLSSGTLLRFFVCGVFLSVLFVCTC